MKNLVIIGLVIFGGMKLGFMAVDNIQDQAQNSMDAYASQIEQAVEGK